MDVSFYAPETAFGESWHQMTVDCCGKLLFGSSQQSAHCIVHIIGERPGTMHRNFSVYITTASASLWNGKGKVDHDITRVVSGISDTAYVPKKAVVEVAGIVAELLYIR